MRHKKIQERSALLIRLYLLLLWQILNEKKATEKIPKTKRQLLKKQNTVIKVNEIWISIWETISMIPASTPSRKEEHNTVELTLKSIVTQGHRFDGPVYM